MKPSRPDSEIQCVDLFCGLGGLTRGLKTSGINVAAGFDADESCRYAYEVNNGVKFFHEDISELAPKSIENLLTRNGPRLLAGCAPCQSFSKYSRAGRSERYIEKWSLLEVFGRLVSQVKPDLVTMENVPQLVDHKVYLTFLESLEDYHIWSEVVECRAYGVPQTRKRLVLLASKLGSISLLKSSPDASLDSSVYACIGGLPPIQAGGVDPCDPLHTSAALGALNMRRIQASKPGGTWRDWEPTLRAACHKRKEGSGYTSVYGRMEWGAPAPTITTQCYGYGNGRFGHPSQDRAISLREAALLQTFPSDYRFIKPNESANFRVLGRQIGNAVPIKLAEAIGESLVHHVRSVRQSFQANDGSESSGPGL